MTPPLVPITLAFALGILLAFHGLGHSDLLFLLGVSSACVSLWCRRRARLSVLALAVLWIVLGLLRASCWQHRAADHVADLGLSERAELAVHGVVTNDPLELWNPAEAAQVAVTRVDHIRAEGAWRSATGLIRARLRASRVPLEYGEEVLLEGRWSTPRAPGNPGQFDWRSALARQRISALLSVEPSQGVARLHPAHGHWWVQAVLALRRRMEALLQRHFSDEQAGLLRAFLLGQRVALQETLKRAFVETGTMHLVVVSGFNVGLLALMLELVLRLAGFPQRPRLVLVGLGLLGYCLLTGMQPPVTRATIMAWVVLGAIWLDRVVNWPNALAMAALIILWINPAQLFDAGFQLSFGAVASLLLFATRFRAYFEARLHRIPSERVRRHLALSLASTLAVWVGLWPMLAWYFHLIAPVSILANLVLVPLVSLLVGVGTSILLVGALIEPVVKWTAPALSLLLHATVRCVHACHAIPLGWWPVGHPSWLVIAGYYALVLCWLLRRQLRLSAGWVLACWLFGVNLWLWSGLVSRMRASRWLEVTVLDVGHGDSIVIRTPDQRTLLVDAGSRDAGQYVVVPFLRFKGWNTLDALILTHEDEDHLGGALALLKDVRVRRLMTNGFTAATRTAREVMETALLKRAVYEPVEAGMSLTTTPDLAMTILHPPRGGVAGARLSSNDNSVVMKLTKGTVSVLLCGDLEERGAPVIMRWGETLHATVVKIPHHGSALGEAQRPFFEAMHPQLAVLSVGWLHHLPSASVLRDLKAAGAQVLLTRESGAVTIRTDGRRLLVDTFR